MLNAKLCSQRPIYSSKSLLFIKHSLWEQKLKTCQEQPDLVCGCFIKVFYKTIISPRQPLLSGTKSGFLTQVWLYILIKIICYELKFL